MLLIRDVAREMATGTTIAEKGGRERRRSTRYLANGSAEFFAAGALARGVVRDFSTTGCLVYTRSRTTVDVGATVQLRFSVANTQFLVDAEVVRISQREYVAFRFISPDAELQTKLADIGVSEAA